MNLTVKEKWLTSGTLLAAVIGAYLFYRYATKSDNKYLSGLVQAVTPPNTVSEKSSDDQITASLAYAQGANAESAYSDEYFDYNTSAVILESGATVGNGNSLNQGTPGAAVVQALIQANVAAGNNLQSPTATAVQAAKPTLNVDLIYNPPIPSYVN